MRILAALLVFLWAAAVQAEPYPAPADLSVNDFADLLSPQSEARLDADLDALRTDIGIEATIVTLADRGAYDPAPSLEAFATRLFNGWGIGDATRNDGILILILSENREMRIELGAGYNPEYDIPAQDIINRVMLPAFRDGQMETGIEAGTREVIERIARRHADGLEPDAKSSSGGRVGWIAMLAFGGIFGFVALRRPLQRVFARLRRCPNCNRRGLSLDRIVTREASLEATGQGIRRESCPSCHWHRDRPYTIPSKRRGGGGGSFGGGRSSGGGASGRW